MGWYAIKPDQPTNNIIVKTVQFPVEGSPSEIMVNVLNCNIIESKFQLQFHYIVHSQIYTRRKCMSRFIPLVMG